MMHNGSSVVGVVDTFVQWTPYFLDMGELFRPRGFFVVVVVVLRGKCVGVYVFFLSFLFSFYLTLFLARHSPHFSLFQMPVLFLICSESQLQLCSPASL